METVKLYTYYLSDKDLVFEVKRDWLQTKIDIPVTQYMEQCTFDDNASMYEVAKKEKAIINQSIVDAEV